MKFGFQLFGLLMVFLLIIIYYSKGSSVILRKKKLFSSILLVTYLLQICNCFIYMNYQGDIHYLFLDKMYCMLVMIWFSLFCFYYLEEMFKDQTVVEHKKWNLKNCLSYFIFFFMGIGIISSLLGYGNYLIDVFMLICLVCELFVLGVGIKKIEKVRYFHLGVIFLIQTVMFLLQEFSLEIPVLNIEIIFSVFYLYFMLEDVSILELEKVKLERDYALSQNFDKSTFLKNLSHEIRTPLNTIDGFSQVILDSEDLEEIKGDVQDIRIASKDLIDVINGTIDLSMIESGNLEIIEENYNVYDMLDSVIDIINAKLKGENLKFEKKIAEDIPEVLLGDSERISQVILNLLMNAMKYTEKGKITLEVESVKSNSRCRLKIIVKDTGRGLKKEDLVKLFEQGKEGTNLGLSVSKYLVELMNGNLEVDTVYGQGSTFTVTIDQRIVHEEDDAKVVRKRALKPFYDSERRVLIVDDNKLNLKVAMKLLAPYGVQVVEANSGQECLDVLDKDTDFDLILMDDLMPGLSGTETLDILKKIERVDGYYIPVVVLTANAISGMKEKYLEAGFEDYLSKPIDKYELDRILKKYLKEKK